MPQVNASTAHPAHATSALRARRVARRLAIVGIWLLAGMVLSPAWAQTFSFERYYFECLSFEAGGDLTTARQSCLNALEVDGDRAVGQLALGRIEFALGELAAAESRLQRVRSRFDDAELEFRRAHELKRSAAQPLINIGSLWLVQGDFQPALVVLREATRLEPRSPAALYYLGYALYKLAQLDEAENALIRALELDRASATRLMLANVYQQQQKYDRAVEQLEAYLEENPEGEERDAVGHLRSRLLKQLKR